MSSERSEFDPGLGLLESILVIWVLNQNNSKAMNAPARLVPASILLQSALLIFQRWAKLRLSTFDLSTWGGGGMGCSDKYVTS